MTLMKFSLYFSVFCAIILTTNVSRSHSRPRNHRRPVLFIFGDSVFDVGNNNYIKTTPDFQTNYSPYGETFFHSPTGRATDGRLIPDFISEYAKFPEFIPPYLQPGINYSSGVNFASGGAGVLVETHHGIVIDLQTQISNFKDVVKKLGDEESNSILSTSVYVFSIGSNDYIYPYVTNSTIFNSYSQQEEYVGMVIGNLTNMIQQIYNLGARKFGFVNLALLGCVPMMRAMNQVKTGDCVDQVSALANQHNKELNRSLKKLETQLSGFKYAVHDFFTSSSERMNYPSRYGFKEGKSGCCGSGPYRGIKNCGGKGTVKEYELCDNLSDYIFFDSIHPTDKAYEQFAKLFWSGNAHVTGPYNLQALFGL